MTICVSEKRKTVGFSMAANMKRFRSSWKAVTSYVREISMDMHEKSHIAAPSRTSETKCA